MFSDVQPTAIAPTRFDHSGAKVYIIIQSSICFKRYSCPSASAITRRIITQNSFAHRHKSMIVATDVAEIRNRVLRHKERAQPQEIKSYRPGKAKEVANESVRKRESKSESESAQTR
eukprot:3487032-Pleurochrysis_carterae.AAC.1